MNTNSKQSRVSAGEMIDIHSIDGLLWGLPVRLGLAAEQRGRSFPRPQGRAWRDPSSTPASSETRRAA